MLVLLDLLIDSPDDMALASDRQVLPRLSAIVDAAQTRVARDDAARAPLQLAVRLVARLAEFAAKSDKRTTTNQGARRQREGRPNLGDGAPS